MRARWLGAIACVLAGCGRVNFDPFGAGVIDAPSIDTPTGDIDDAPNTATYLAAIAECIDPGTPDPAFCRSINGNTELPVDLDDANLNVPFYSYLRFDFDQTIAGRQITAVSLRVVISDGAQSDGPSTGEIWRVATFTATSLQTQAPAQLGGVPIGADQGAVVQLQPVVWALPSDVIDGGPLCVGMIPVTAAGVNYFNLQGADPPRVRIDFL
ncbi:MAG TPA: hypothetical protein VIV11_38710 [Kofleriaceae bacterium]